MKSVIYLAYLGQVQQTCWRFQIAVAASNWSSGRFRVTPEPGGKKEPADFLECAKASKLTRRSFWNIAFIIITRVDMH